MTEVLIVVIVAMIALGALFALALALHWGHKRDHGLVPYVFYFSLFAAGIGIAMSPRDMSMQNQVSELITGRHPLIIWAGRFSSLFILLSCGERILHRLVKRDVNHPLPKLLVGAFVLYFLTNVISPALFGRHSNVAHDYLYVGLVGIAATLFTVREVETMLTTLRNALLVFTAVSLAFLLVSPGKVADTHYVGLVPFLHLRFTGLAPHANVMGPLSVTLLICLWRRPFERVWLTRIAAAMGLLSLVLTQSKTSWVAFLLTVGCISYYTYRDLIVQRITDHRRPFLPVAIVSAAMLMLLGLTLVLMFGDVGSKLSSLAASREGEQLSSFSGRDVIWEVAMQEWRRNPIFGYGLTIWDASFLASIRMPFAVHAHSQFFQTVSSAGTVGLIGLVVYLAVLTYAVIRTTRVSGGLTLAMYLTILMRGVSEVPLMMTAFGPDSIGHLLLVAVLAGYYRAALPAKSTAAQRASAASTLAPLPARQYPAAQPVPQGGA